MAMNSRWASGVGTVAAAVLCIAAIRRGGGMPASEMEARAGLARIHARAGEYCLAVKLLEDMVRESGESPYARLALARVLFEKGEYGRAEQHYRALLREDGDSPVVLFNLARTLESRNPEEAAVLFTRFLSLYADALPALAEKARRALGAEGRG